MRKFTIPSVTVIFSYFTVKNHVLSSGGAVNQRIQAKLLQLPSCYRGVTVVTVESHLSGSGNTENSAFLVGDGQLAEYIQR